MKKSDTGILKIYNNRYLIVLIIIILFIISTSYIGFYNVDLFGNNKKKNNKDETSNKDVIVSSNITKPEQEENNTELKLGNINSDKENLQNSHNPNLYETLKNSTPSEKYIESGIKHKNISIQTQAALNSYSNYLGNLTVLAINFLQDKSYTEQLYKIQNIELPYEINNILVDLLYYNNNYLLNDAAQIERTFPTSSCWIEKFI